jgi:2-polyprenyl-3-methyl-5-hydroxy-6-metoxy-1,4-benzoquinol methylase
MKSEEIRSHWEALAMTHGEEVLATTKTGTAKQIETGVLEKVFKLINPDEDASLRVLEAGCGNGVNIFSLASSRKSWDFYGFDFATEMIRAAHARKSNLNFTNTTFGVSDFSAPDVFGSDFDIIFTVRALINLTTAHDQLAALESLTNLLTPGGYLVFLENFKDAHMNQNRMREILDLKPRKTADYNLFLDEKEIVNQLDKLGLEGIRVFNYSGLHDVLLYILFPFLNDGEVNYSEEVVRIAALFTSRLELDDMDNLGTFGQNRLVIARKPKKHS